MLRRSRKNREIIADLRERRGSCGAMSQTFNHDLPMKYRKMAEKYAQDAFIHWWDSWVEPLIAEAEERMVKETPAYSRPKSAFVDLKVKGYSTENVIPIIKELRASFNLSLVEARDAVVDGKTFAKLRRPLGEAVARRLIEVGALIDLGPSL